MQQYEPTSLLELPAIGPDDGTRSGSARTLVGTERTGRVIFTDPSPPVSPLHGTAAPAEHPPRMWDEDEDEDEDDDDLLGDDEDELEFDDDEEALEEEEKETVEGDDEEFDFDDDEEEDEDEV